MDNPLLLFSVVAAIIVLAVLAPRWIRRSSGSLGRRAGRRFEEEQLRGILADLGTTVVLHTSPERARSLVDDIVRQDPRRFAVLGPGLYGIRFLEPDDAVARLVPVADGVRLGVEQFGEHLGRPNTSGFWNDLRALTVATADAHGIDARVPDDRLLFHRAAVEGPVWVRSRPEE